MFTWLGLFLLFLNYFRWIVGAFCVYELMVIRAMLVGDAISDSCAEVVSVICMALIVVLIASVLHDLIVLSGG